MTRVYFAVVVSLLGAAFVVWLSATKEEEGRQAERAATERENLHGRNKADDADGELMRCVTSRGVFDFRTGKCGGAR